MTRFLRGFLLPLILAGACLASPARAQMSESELVMRLNRLENQVRQLTGQVEQLQYRNQQLEQQLGRAAQGGPPPQRAAAPPQYSPQPQPYPAQPQSYPQQQAYPPQPNVMQQEPEPALPPRGGRRGDAFDPYQNPNAPGVPRVLGAPATVAAAPPLGATASDEPPYVGAPGGRQAGDPLDLGIMAEEAANAPPPRREVRQIPGALPAPSPRNPSGTGTQMVMA